MIDDVPKWVLILLEELRKVRELNKTSPQTASILHTKETRP